MASKRKAKRENPTSFAAKRCHLQPSFLVGCPGERVECLRQDTSKTNNNWRVQVIAEKPVCS